LKGWLVYNKQRYDKNSAYAQLYVEWCHAHGVEITLVFEERVTHGICTKGFSLFYDNAQVMAPDFAIFRCEAPELRQVLEAAGVLVTNSARLGAVANDKMATYRVAFALGVDFLSAEVMPKAGGYPSLPFPLVVKPRYGHGGVGVTLIEDRAAYQRFIAENVAPGTERAWLAQCVCPVVGQDLRVYVLGGRILTAMLRTAPTGELRSNYSLGGSAAPYVLDSSQRAHVQRIADALGTGYYGIDFFFDESGGLLLNEVEDVVGSRMLFAHSSIDVVNSHLSYVLGLVRGKS